MEVIFIKDTFSRKCKKESQIRHPVILTLRFWYFCEISSCKRLLSNFALWRNTSFSFLNWFSSFFSSSRNFSSFLLSSAFFSESIFFFSIWSAMRSAALGLSARRNKFWIFSLLSFSWNWEMQEIQWLIFKASSPLESPWRTSRKP